MPVLFDKEGNPIQVDQNQIAQMLAHGLTKNPPGEKQEAPVKETPQKKSRKK